MKNIEIDAELYQYIVKNTEKIGESASSILRRLLSINQQVIPTIPVKTEKNNELISGEVEDKAKEFKTVNFTEKTPLLSSEKIDSSLNNKNIPKTADYLFNYINKEELAMQRGVVGRFLLILAALNRVHPKNFEIVTEIRGKGRLYFAKNADDLEASGSSTKPKKIAESQFWVITNTNTTRKKMMLTVVAIELGYSQEDAEKIRELL